MDYITSTETKVFSDNQTLKSIQQSAVTLESVQGNSITQQAEVT